MFLPRIDTSIVCSICCPVRGQHNDHSSCGATENERTCQGTISSDEHVMVDDAARANQSK